MTGLGPAGPKSTSGGAPAWAWAAPQVKFTSVPVPALSVVSVKLLVAYLPARVRVAVLPLAENVSVSPLKLTFPVAAEAKPPRYVLTVETNYGVHGVKSGAFYTHFALLRSLEGGFGLPCLDHACDDTSKSMVDLFAERR